MYIHHNLSPSLPLSFSLYTLKWLRPPTPLSEGHMLSIMFYMVDWVHVHVHNYIIITHHNNNNIHTLIFCAQCHVYQARRKQFTCGPASFKSEHGANYARKTRGVWGHAPPGKFCNLQPQKLLLMAFETTFTGQYLDFVVWPKSQLRFSETENFW